VLFGQPLMHLLVHVAGFGEFCLKDFPVLRPVFLSWFLRMTKGVPSAPPARQALMNTPRGQDVPEGTPVTPGVGQT